MLEPKRGRHQVCGVARQHWLCTRAVTTQQHAETLKDDICHGDYCGIDVLEWIIRTFLNLDWRLSNAYQGVGS